MHSHDLLHHDLKPENILIDFDDNIKLSNFDLATRIFQSQYQMYKLASSPFSQFGSWLFWSSEMFNGIIEKRSEVFTVAIIASFMITKTLPYQEYENQHCKQTAI